MQKEQIRHDWTIEELQELYALPLFQLISTAHTVHTQYHVPGEVQICTLISFKTGGCPEDCKYCAQSSRYQTPVSAQPMMSYEEVLREAKKAIDRGASRICLGAAWRSVRDGKQFDEVLRMIRGITAMRAEVCCTLGMITQEQAKRLKEAGLYAYSHNLDSSERFYKTIITTRTYQDRLNTLDILEQENINVCCGGIMGMGEEPIDRLELIHTLSKRDPHPSSVPINRLSRIPGTPLENQKEILFWDFLRIIAIARIVLPRAMVRLSAGRLGLSYQEQALCFLCGANSLHTGEKLLTVPNTSLDKDEEMFELLGLVKK